MRSIEDNKSCPATIVCVGGFPLQDNDHTAEVWYRGEKIKGFPTHRSAELIADYLVWSEERFGVKRTVEYCQTFSVFYSNNELV